MSHMPGTAIISVVLVLYLNLAHFPALREIPVAGGCF
jgi:hypothetical protein